MELRLRPRSPDKSYLEIKTLDVPFGLIFSDKLHVLSFLFPLLPF